MSVPATPAVQARRVSYHQAVVAEVSAAVASDKVVVLGMGWNPHVRKARKTLDARGVPYRYLGFGNYVTGWKPRLAIKLWAAWPTFPMVFVNGTLVGGASDLLKAMDDGSFEALRQGERAA